MANEPIKGSVFLQKMFSEGEDPSVTRVLMVTFSIFVIVLVSCIVHHMLHVADLPQLTVWISNFPVMVGVLSGFVVLPYTVMKGAKTVGNLFGSRGAAAQDGMQQVAGNVSNGQ